MDGRPLEVLSRDDGGETSNAMTLANQLVAGEGVALLSGTFLSNVGLAVSDFARQKEVLFIAAEPLSTQVTWEQGHRYTWRLRPNTYMQNDMLATAAAARRDPLGDHRANYEYGQSAVEEFKKLLKERKPEVEFVEEQWPALGKLDAGRPCRRSRRPSPTRSTTRPSRAIWSSSCARAPRAACSRAARW